ncbi:unnamed protein product [Ilex paraguariensis]|uniref:Uncharacterized protein n=1 Tax=Ilex paraguariensis TaxID=185542 RepID=A0ABC8V1D5_9AQUA
MGAGLSQDKANATQSDKEQRESSEIPVINADTTEKRSEVKLPHRYEAILKDADSPIDSSSTEKLYEQLYAGVFLNKKRKKYWVERKSTYNSFMLFARDLSITWADDNRFWHWPYLPETNNVLIDVAELLNVSWLEIHGKFETTKLSPGVTYEVVFVVMLRDPAYGWQVPVNLRLILPDGSRQEHKENMMEKTRGRWIEIPAGEFTTLPEKDGEVEFSLYDYDGGVWKRGLVIKGVAIRPKD